MFKIHSIDSAPQESKETLRSVRDKFGMLPNLYGGLAESPAALQAYAAISDAFGSSSLSPAEQQVVLLSTSVENECDYCVAAHSTVAATGELLDEETLDALRSGKALPNERLEALRSFTVTVVRERGHLADGAVDTFLDAGFETAHVLDVVTGVAMKTLSNYTNHVIETPVDGAFEEHRWEIPSAV